MDGFDTSPIDPRLMPKPVLPAVLPVANGAPVQPEAAPAVLPRVPMQTSQPQQTQGLAFPQVGIQGRSPVQEKLASTQEQGSGISRIHNPVLKTLATVGDVLAGTFAPRAEQLIPGTEGNHALRLAQANNAVKGEQEQLAAPIERRLKTAQAAEAESLPDLHQAQAELNQRKQEEVETGHRNTEEINRLKTENQQATAAAARKSTLAQHGFKENEKGEIVPLEYSEMSESQQAVHDLKAAQAEQAEATAQLKKAQSENQPQVAALAQARLASAQEAHNIAARRLGLSEQQFEMRAHGTQNGVPLNGALLTDEGQPVGTAFQQNVRPTGTQRDAAARGDTMMALDKRIRAALQNPEIAKGTGPLAGRLAEAQGRLGTLPHDLAELRNDLVSYGAFQAGLHPVRGIGALEYFDKVMGGLGQNPQELLGKLDSNMATAGHVRELGTPKTVGSNQNKPEPAEKKAEGGYQIGHKYGGMEYLGGPVNDQNNWKK